MLAEHNERNKALADTELICDGLLCSAGGTQTHHLVYKLGITTITSSLCLHIGHVV